MSKTPSWEGWDEAEIAKELEPMEGNPRVRCDTRGHSGYENFEKADCTDCQKQTFSGIRYDALTTEKEFICIGRGDLIQEIFALRNEVRALRASGLIVKGWWCMLCDRFNGEEKEVRHECSRCGRDKAGKLPCTETAGEKESGEP